MGCINSIPEANVFQADMFILSKQYFETMMYIKETQLFKQRTKKLQETVDEYLKSDWLKFKSQSNHLKAVDTVHKLHPFIYDKKSIDRQYLINACLRQNEFCNKINFKELVFYKCLKSYINFLHLIKARPGKITVPSLHEDFMWHSHMQDPAKYKTDTIKIIGKFLNHDDQIPKDKLKQNWNEALKQRQTTHNQNFKEYQT